MDQQQVCPSHAALHQGLTGGEDHFPADQPLLDDGELGQLQHLHPRDGGVVPLPEEDDVIHRVTICGEEGAHREN